MVYGSESLQSLKEKEMNAMERLENSMIRVRALINFYKQHPTTTLDMMDGLTAVTIGDLNILLAGLADRDISISEMPELVPLRETIRDIKVAKEKLDKEEEFDVWIKGYDKGYESGRNGELKRIEFLLNNYIKEIRGS